MSPEQKELSDKLVENYKKGIDSLVFAVCGSGKTEISLQVIQYVINCGERVAFAVPRKDVVIELYNRLKDIFNKNSVVAVYGGHHNKLDADLVILTTHQLYRYDKYFSLIVLDEIDAFPFKDNEVLRNIFFKSLIGHYVMMSATPTKEALELFKGEKKDILRLDTRFHKHPLPLPRVLVSQSFIRYFYLFKYTYKYIKSKKPLFVFAPTIDECERIYKLLSILFKGGEYVHSKRIQRNEIIMGFRQQKYKFLVTTSVLERGVTVKDLQVIIWNANDRIYDSGTLVQIAGRAGRKKDAPTGEVIFIARKETESIRNARRSINNSNKALQNMLSGD